MEKDNLICWTCFDDSFQLAYPFFSENYLLSLFFIFILPLRETIDLCTFHLDFRRFMRAGAYFGTHRRKRIFIHTKPVVEFTVLRIRL